MKQRTFKQRQRWATFWFILLLVVSNFTLPSRAQVTIGSNERPVSGAILQLKEKENVLNDTLNSYKGFGLPRVTLSDKYQLYPMFLNNPEDPTSGSNGQYSVNKETLDKTHTGLLVYNLIENEEKELCIGLNQWNGKEWNCFQTKMGNAIADIKDCNTLKFKGQYQNDVALNSSNYLTIDLTVTKAGAYTITAISDPENGYYFTLTGVFLTTGDYTITVPGAGTPINHTEGTPGDLMKITFNGKVLDSCDPLYVQVEDSSKKPLFVMNCALTKVRGVYKIDTPLDPATNYIEMTLNVDLAGIGATYIIETNTVDGIYFKGQGLLSSTTQNIKLIGYGTPNSLNDKKFTITSNSKKTTATCEATVIMVIPKKRMLVLGTAATYGWVPGTSGVGSYEVLMSDNNFGTKERNKLPQN
ncbi:hypothetical protein [Dysgonomonas sp. Marseille-P4677]|uniref:hypothetical protein n=1 Tax=Dysgonomonas sp. Marseille-P4677 TaxID=2364790 RepID=UPI001F2E6FFB|nr:hypothetical protein [Dysgonomonas sp. Marseille-P4677]